MKDGREATREETDEVVVIPEPANDWAIRMQALFELRSLTEPEDSD